MNYVKSLMFTERPDYAFLKALFCSVLKENHL